MQQINAWYVAGRDPATGAYPDFPSAAAGGSKAILAPPPPSVAELLAAAGGGGAGGAGAAGGTGKKPGSAKPGSAKPGARPTATASAADGAAGAGAAPPPQQASAFVPLIEAAVAEYAAKWRGRDEAANAAQAHDPELAKEELRPLVFEEVRLQVGARALCCVVLCCAVCWCECVLCV